MKNKDLRHLLDTFPDDAEVCVIVAGGRGRKPIEDVSERRKLDRTVFLLLETAPRPTENGEQSGFHSDTRNVHIYPQETK